MKTIFLTFNICSLLLLTRSSLFAQSNTLLAKGINEQWKRYESVRKGGTCSCNEEGQTAMQLNDFISAFIQLHGFPGGKEVGRVASQHFTDLLSWPLLKPEILKSALELMKNKVLGHQADTNIFARLFDQAYYREKGKQYYGTILILCDNTFPKTFKSVTIDLADEVDSRRQSIGLQPLATYMGKLEKIATAQ